ncbi:MAG TPA: MFS transporter [Acetobacteraceae bacterium]|nr:MFS transporter [Acetobacteraceae bacterium]
MRTDAWLLSYGLLGFTQNGLLPILLPLVAPAGSSAGTTYAAFALLGLFAPVMGTWADRTGRHRDLLIWGTLMSGLLLLLFELGSAPARVVLAAGAGLGAMAATTAGNVLAIQGWPEAEWDGRVAGLQRFISAGQVVGLIGAGVLAHSAPSYGFVVAGGALLAAGALAFATAPGRLPRNSRDKPVGRPMVGGDAGVTAAHHQGHHVGWQELRAYLAVINQPLRRFLIVWLVAYPAMNGIATMFPVAMTREFGMDPILPSSAYAIGVGFSLLLYPKIGVATHRLGGGRMLIAGLGARLLLLILLTPAGVWHSQWAGWSILVGFALIQLVWPLLGVAANALSVRLAPTARGESVGLFNAATSLAASVGSALAGVIFSAAGFAALTGITCLSIAVALVLAILWVPRRHPSLSACAGRYSPPVDQPQ